MRILSTADVTLAGVEVNPSTATVHVEGGASRNIAADVGRFDISAAMTLLLLLMAAPGYWYAKVPLCGLAFAGLLMPEVRRHRWVWLSTTALITSFNYYHFYTADNHKHLLGYWCLALYLALLAPNPDRALGVSARLMVALAFGFATFWKLYSPDFLSGAFFRYSILFDDRFRNLAEVLGNMSADDYESNRVALMNLHMNLLPYSYAKLVTTEEIGVIARVMAWWTLIIEGAIAVCFVVPARTVISRFRDVPLLLFASTTYMLAPVLGFGYLLLAMGVAQSPQGARMRAAYLAVFIGLIASTAPWRQVVEFMVAVR